jgi:hypothetical protein
MWVQKAFGGRTVIPHLFMLLVAGPALADIGSPWRTPAAVVQHGCMSNWVMAMDFLGRESRGDFHGV